ncbi:MAG: sigma-70 family RNA polymerase sigma factor [Flavobacteriales bacterium]|nr:sigma-70 family RNA polymerase sigma factor [Flavobacteriales bacterium]
MPPQDEFRALYHQHARMVYNLCLNYLHSREDAQEATQDVFVKVHERLAGFKGDASVTTWIYRITINTCLDRLKARKRKKRSLLNLFSLSDEQVERSASMVFDHPGVAAEDREALERLFTLIDKLPEQQKTALLLKTTEDLSMNAIAEVMGLTPKAVESLLSRGRANLRQYKRTSEG